MHADRGWSEGIGGWEEKCPPVLAIHIGGIGGTSKDVVPFQDVIFGWMGDYVWRRIGLDRGILASELEVD